MNRPWPPFSRARLQQHGHIMPKPWLTFHHEPSKRQPRRCAGYCLACTSYEETPEHGHGCFSVRSANTKVLRRFARAHLRCGMALT